MLPSGPDSRVPPFAFTEVCPVLQNQIQQPSRSGESTKTEHPRTTGFLSFICRFSWRDREGRLYTSACVGGLISIKGHSCCATNERTSKPFLSLALKFQSSGRLYLTTVPPPPRGTSEKKEDSGFDFCLREVTSDKHPVNIRHGRDKQIQNQA